MLHLLLIDDNPDDRALVLREIQKVLADARVDQVGERVTFEALTAQPELPWDVVVTDYQLRWSTGMEVFRSLRERRPDLPVILFTASGSEELAVQALKEGVDDYITKTPRHYGRVPYAIRACAERRQQKRDADAAAAALRAREAHLQLAMDAGAMTAWQLDLASGLILLDGRENGPFGGARAVSATEVLASVHTEDRDRMRATWDQARVTGARFEIEFRMLMGEKERWLRASAIRGGAMVDDRWVGVVQDVTRAKRTEAQLRSADREKNEFIAMLAHELRNPLAPLRYLGQLLAQRPDTAQLERAREIIERQVGVMARLLDDLLDVSQLTYLQPVIRAEPLDLGEVVRHAAADAAPALVHHRFTLSVPSAPVRIEGDRVRLQEILQNLIDNAVKFTPAGGSINLRLETSERHAVLVLQDSGIGVDPELIERIFAPFVQARASATEPHRGLGLGLAVVQKLVQAHGGTVRARSGGSAQGFTIEIHLPLSTQATAEPTRASPVSGSPTGGLRVLVADDEQDLAETLRDLLGLEGHEVILAYDGASAIAAAESFRPQVMVLDIGMPNGSGDAVAQWVRQQPWGAEVKLIAVTGWGRSEDRDRTQRAGFDLHLVKPVGARLLIEAVAEPKKD